MLTASFFSHHNPNNQKVETLPRPKNLEELRGGLLYNNTLDVWTALCAERGRDWKRLDEYYQFLEHLKSQSVKLDLSVVCPPIKGFSDKPPKAFNIRLDAPTIQKIRLFDAEGKTS